MSIKTAPFDAAEYLIEQADQAELLADALASGDAGYVANALGIIARARGMTELARETGLSRQALYAALSPEGNPTLGTVLKVAGAVGLQLSAKVAAPQGELATA